MSPLLRVVLAPETTVEGAALVGPHSRTSGLSPVLLAALTAGLELGWALVANGSMMDVLDELHRRRQVAWELVDEDGLRRALMWPRLRGVPLPLPDENPAHLRLSRFALLRGVDDGWLIESGRSPLVVELTDSGAAELVRVEDLPASPLAVLLRAGGLLSDSDASASPLWEFHDRYFTSLATGDVAPSGGTYRFVDQIEPEPFDSGRRDGRRVALPEPDRSNPGPGLWELTSRRRSIRDFSDSAVPLAALSEALFYTLRVQRVSSPRGGDSRSYESAQRPVPSAGATHALSLWLHCANVEGLEPGLWRYDPRGHALVNHQLETEPEGFVDPQIPVSGYLVLRHPRLAWKYERIAVSLALQDCGVQLHALQLGAAAVGLAFVPIGAGPTSAISRGLGLDPELDVPLGHFWLGVPHGLADEAGGASS